MQNDAEYRNQPHHQESGEICVVDEALCSCRLAGCRQLQNSSKVLKSVDNG
jgi:hypothetical protein